MYNFLISLIVIASILLVLVVLVQNSKGGGLTSEFSGTNQVFGAKKTADLVEKITWGLVAFIVVLCIISTAFIKPVKNYNPSPSVTVEDVATETPTAGFEVNQENN